jgi:hypothetical protein
MPTHIVADEIRRNADIEVVQDQGLEVLPQNKKGNI